MKQGRWQSGCPPANLAQPALLLESIKIPVDRHGIDGKLLGKLVDLNGPLSQHSLTDPLLPLPLGIPLAPCLSRGSVFRHSDRPPCRVIAASCICSLLDFVVYCNTYCLPKSVTCFVYLFLWRRV